MKRLPGGVDVALVELEGRVINDLPRIHSPPHAAVENLAPQATAPLVVTPTLADVSWSEFNHNVAGLFLAAMALFALVCRFGRASWTRHWPLGFLGLGAFLAVRSDPNDWPLGHIDFWQGMLSAETLQHRLAVVLVVVLGLLEWRARTVERPGSLPDVFPILCVAGAVLLLTHSHSALNIKFEYLIEVTHTAIGVLAVLMACGRWLELRLDGAAARFAGVGADVALLLIGMVLMFYREPL